MKYFLIEKNSIIKNVPEVINWYKRFNKKALDDKEYEKIPYRTTLQIKENNNVKFIDIILNPFFMVSEELKNLLAIFEPNLKYKVIFLIDSENKKMGQYFIPLLDKIDCLSESSEFNLDKTIIKKGIIDEKKLKDKAIFMIDNMKSQQIVMRMDLVEAILRRDFLGMRIKELYKEEG